MQTKKMIICWEAGLNCLKRGVMMNKRLESARKYFKTDPVGALCHSLIKFFDTPSVNALVSDSVYLKVRYRDKMGKRLNLKNPQSFNEKVQWLKLHDRNPFYATLVDKHSVQGFVSEKIGSSYLVPQIGIWERVEDIDFEDLPNKFVLKTTHDSGGVVICRDKNSLDVEEAKNKLQKSMENNWYSHSKEWHYKNVKPRIICQELIETSSGLPPVDYKILCFNGKPENIMVCIDRFTRNLTYHFFDWQWKFLKYNKMDPDNFEYPRPEKLEEMFRIAEKLSQGIILCRVDLYCENNKIYFGEITFFPDSGFDTDITSETDYYFGSKIDLRMQEV